jgi:hypothetical protein
MNAPTTDLAALRRTLDDTISTKGLIDGISQRLGDKQKRLFDSWKALTLSTPLVESTRSEYEGMKLLVLTAKRRGLLMDMILAELGMDPSNPFPQLKWVMKKGEPGTSYEEPYYRDQNETFFFEEVFAGQLSLYGNTLPMAIPPKMVNDGLVQEGTHHFGSDDRATRVSDIFVGPELLQYRAGKLSKTLFMSEFGAGSRVFLKAA